MRHLIAYISRSTLKREFASTVFFMWMILGFFLMHRIPTTQVNPDAALSAWISLEPYMFTLVTAAFGADFVAKQTNIAGPPTNTQTTVKAEVTDTAATVTTTQEPVQ